MVLKITYYMQLRMGGGGGRAETWYKIEVTICILRYGINEPKKIQKILIGT